MKVLFNYVKKQYTSNYAKNYETIKIFLAESNFGCKQELNTPSRRCAITYRKIESIV